MLKALKNIVKNYWCFITTTFFVRLLLPTVLALGLLSTSAQAVMVEFNSTGGTTATDGLRIYIDDSTQIQVRRLNNTGQVYEPNTLPPSTNLDNGIFLRANGLVYGPDHNVTTFAPTGGMYSTSSISATSPANPSTVGDQQTATHNFGITSGPQVTVVWKYTTALDFLTAEVTLVIPAGYAVSTANPVRYYHVFDTYLGGSDNGCGFQLVDSNGKRVVGTYPPASGTTCPSNTSIPTGVSVVESFRERSGLNFSNYCASGWSSFWVNGSTNCSILQSANMSNNIATTFQDTGIGIQYNFTAAGTYTFSYDFVVGSPLVPPYDHLEIRHPGTTSLCPANITVLACTSSTVPCPAANVVNTGTLTGSIRQVPGAPSITQTPSSFTLGSSASTATIVFQGTGAGTFTLNGQGLSATPLNGTRCWNTTTNTLSCSFTVTNTPCVSGFECIETGVNYNNLTTSPTARNPLYTKLTGTGFRFDVVALQSSGAVANTYTASSGVTVELFDDTTPAVSCSAYSSPIASQAMTFVAGDNGRKTLASDLTVNTAHRQLRCRVRDSNVNVFGCSSDRFSIRPQSFSLSQAGLGASPVIAGSSFTLTATSGVSGYNGTPELLSSRTRAASTAGGTQANIGTGMLTNTSNGTVTDSVNNMFPIATGSPASASMSLRYHDVGFLNFNAGAVIDDGFTAIDQTNDCISGSGSNILSTGKYGCEVWSNAWSDIGRFRPDHFSLTSTVVGGCNAGTTAASTDDFTYMSEPDLTISAIVKAESSQNITSSRYGNACPTAGSCRLNITAQNNSTQLDASRLQPSTTFPTGTTLVGSGVTSSYQSTTWVNGEYTLSGGPFRFNRGASADGPFEQFNLRFAVTDPDSVGFTGSATTANTKLRYGRLWMPNLYGSELLPLSSNIEAQYWNGTAYQLNQQDSCSVIPANTIAMGNYRNNLTACETQISGGGTLNAGRTTANLTKPGAGNSGSLDLTINLNGASGSTCNSATASSATNANMPWFGNNPNARATFGIFKTPVIYMRENF